MAIEKYGKENFKKEIICECNSFDELCKKEKEIIRKHNAVSSYKYYNIDYGGYQKPNVMLDDKQRRKFYFMKEKMKNKSTCYLKAFDAFTKGNKNPGVIFRKIYHEKIGDVYGKQVIIYNNSVNRYDDGKSSTIQVTDLYHDDYSDGFDWEKKNGFIQISEDIYNKFCGDKVQEYNLEAINAFENATTYFNKVKKESIANIEISNITDIKVPETKIIKPNAVTSMKGKEIAEYIKTCSKQSKDYKNFSRLVDEFAEYGIELSVVFNAITGYGSIQPAYLNNFECSDKQYKEARETLNYVLRFKDIVDRVKGRKSFFYMCLCSCYRNEGINNEELFRKLHRTYKNVQPITQIKSLQDTMNQINNIYNYNKNARDKVNIAI